MPTIDQAGIPQALKDRTQWVVWRLEQRKGKAKPTKVPYQARPGLAHASSTDPATWAGFHDAVERYEQGGVSGVGYVFAANDPFAGVDLDGVIDPETGEVAQWAADTVAELASFTEVSQSGTGLHVIVEGKLPGKGFKHQNRELYDSARFFVVTGRHWPGTPSTIEPRQAELTAVFERWKQTRDGKRAKPAPAAATPAPELPQDDAELLERIRKSEQGARFDRLWSGDTGDYGGDHSAADLALCSILAFWTAKDAERMDRLFRQSALIRPKWAELRGEHSYGVMTIDKAIEGCIEVYRGKKGEKPATGKH